MHRIQGVQKLKTTDCSDGSRLVFSRTTEHVTKFTTQAAYSCETRKAVVFGSPIAGKMGLFPGNIILIWIALRARASHVRNVGLGLWSNSKTEWERPRKSFAPPAPRPSAGRNLLSSWARPACSICRCFFSSGVTSTGSELSGFSANAAYVRQNLIVHIKA